jgi:hypothetical protein
MVHPVVTALRQFVAPLSRTSALILMACTSLGLAAQGEQPPADHSKVFKFVGNSISPSPIEEQRNLPVRISIKGKTEYVLDTGGLTPAEYKRKVEKASESGRPLPTPEVDLTVEITNTSDKPVEIWTGGDPVRLVLTLDGDGALNLTPPLAFTREFRLPKAETLAPGKSIAFRLTELTSGFRGRSHFAYWTNAGTYKLTCSFSTGIKPAPPGTKEEMDGFGRILISSEPLIVTVKLKESK